MSAANRSDLARILAHEDDYWSTIAQVTQFTGWRAYCNPRLTPRINPNHAGDFRYPVGQGQRIVQEVLDFFQQNSITPAAYVDLLAPVDLIPALLQAGFAEWIDATCDLLCYAGPDLAAPSTVVVEVVTSDQDREAWAAIIDEETPADKRLLLRDLYLTEISDPRITAYLIRVNGEPACRAELFAGGGLGRVEAVRTMARYRNRGLAAAAVRRAIQDSQAMGHTLTYLYAEPGSNAERLYQRLGFRILSEKVMRSFILG